MGAIRERFEMLIADTEAGGHYTLDPKEVLAIADELDRERAALVADRMAGSRSGWVQTMQDQQAEIDRLRRELEKLKG